jgi:hypothetical protein
MFLPFLFVHYFRPSLPALKWHWPLSGGGGTFQPLQRVILPVKSSRHPSSPPQFSFSLPYGFWFVFLSTVYLFWNFSNVFKAVLFIICTAWRYIYKILLKYTGICLWSEDTFESRQISTLYCTVWYHIISFLSWVLIFHFLTVSSFVEHYYGS